MKSIKKILLYSAVLIVVSSSLSGCILNQIFGTSFSLVSFDIVDDDGFAGISMSFTNTGTVTVNMYNPSGNIVDSELFLRSNNDAPNDAILHLASYKETASPGQYRLVVYDKNDNTVSEETFNINEPKLSISSCNQIWWKRELLNLGYSLIGLDIEVYNHGNVPVYPYKVDLLVDSQTFSGFILPCVIKPNENKNMDCFIYKSNTPKENIFTLFLKDVDGNVLSSDSFAVDTSDNVLTKEFKWSYNGLSRRLIVPYPKFLFDYYSSLGRIFNEDYGLYVFDNYDEDYLDLLVDLLPSDDSDLDTINFVASFVQNLKYKKDNDENESFEYPRYPVETLFNGEGGGDCEDKAILAASILRQMSYDVALFRLTNHMAVGVHLSKNISGYEVYSDGYYFLETTSIGATLGYVPSEYKSRSNLTVYHISSRPLLVHSWQNNSLTIFRNTELGDFVKVTSILENLGSVTAENILFKGAFYTSYNQELNARISTVFKLGPGMKEEVTMIVYIPKDLSTVFKTKIYLYDEIVDEKEALASFP